MDEKEIAEKKLYHLASAKDLSNAIQKLEDTKERMENDLKKEAHYFFENLKPINLLNRALKNVQEEPGLAHSLFKKGFEVGAGYFSATKLIRKFKSTIINTFTSHEIAMGYNPVPANVSKEAVKQAEARQEDKKLKEMNNQNQNEKVKAKPEKLPEPTYWPFFLAMGLAFLGWGLLTTWLISLAGFIILIVSLIGWINILRHE